MAALNRKWCPALNNDGSISQIDSIIQWGNTKTAALLQGAGTSTTKESTSLANKNFMGYWLESKATSGTSRGMYLRLYLSGGAGGEAGRFFTTVENNSPADTCNGIHASLSFGASAGNISGLGTAGRFTLHVPDRALNGTCGAIQSELYADGDSSSAGGVLSLFRCAIDGDATGKAALEDSAYLFDLSTGSNGSGNIVGAAGNEPTWTGKTYLIR